MPYKHTQIGYLIIYGFVSIILLFGYILTQTGFALNILILVLVILAIIASFTSLKVVIDDTYLRIKFGYGLFRKKFLLKEIASAKAVRNHWYYGWGIRLWLWPSMLIFNVSGLDAVEIKIKTRGTYRIGTDEPKKLEEAIQQAIK